MAKFVELRRHTANEGDRLTAEGVEAALVIGSTLNGGYEFAASSGAQRATQTLACFLAGLGEKMPGGVIVEPALRSATEDRWRAAYAAVGKGDLKSLGGADPDLLAGDSAKLAEGLRRILERLGHGEMALAVGHSPTNEAAVYGLTGEIVAPLAKGDGVLVVEDAGGYRVEKLR